MFAKHAHLTLTSQLQSNKKLTCQKVLVAHLNLLRSYFVTQLFQKWKNFIPVPILLPSVYCSVYNNLNNNFTCMLTFWQHLDLLDFSFHTTKCSWVICSTDVSIFLIRIYIYLNETYKIYKMYGLEIDHIIYLNVVICWLFL